MLVELAKLSIEDTPLYDPNENELKNADEFPALDEEPEVTMKWGGQSLNAEILVTRGDGMARGQEVYQKHDAAGNQIRTTFWISWGRGNGVSS